VSAEKPSACSLAVARFREKVGPELWRSSDEVLFRAAWNEGATCRIEQDRNLRSDLDGARKAVIELREELERSRPVLDALRRIPEAKLRSWIQRGFASVVELAKAELARREGTRE
jgi:hypothetical protein